MACKNCEPFKVGALVTVGKYGSVLWRVSGYESDGNIRLTSQVWADGCPRVIVLPASRVRHWERQAPKRISRAIRPYVRTY